MVQGRTPAVVPPAAWPGPSPPRSLPTHGLPQVATIHQPNCTISSMFDDFVMLACGRTLYSGPWGGAVGFFGACGFRCVRAETCPWRGVWSLECFARRV